MNRTLFQNADFRRLFLGRLVTNAGDSLYAVAAMWLVYSLSGSTLYTGIDGELRGPTVMWLGSVSMLRIVLYVIAVPALRTMPAPMDAEPYERPTGV